MARLPRPKRKLIQQVCVVPYRRRNDGETVLEFCLITSLVKKRWIFPKGIIDPGETPVQAALKEVWEEAGLRGEIMGEPLGQFNDQKWGCDLHVQVMMMEVREVAERWPEINQRQRRWASLSEALDRLNRAELKAFLRVASERLVESAPPRVESTHSQAQSAPGDS